MVRLMPNDTSLSRIFFALKYFVVFAFLIWNAKIMQIHTALLTDLGLFFCSPPPE